jgi:hypothetical protein
MTNTPHKNDTLTAVAAVGGIIALAAGLPYLVVSSISNRTEERRHEQETRAAYATQAEKTPATQVPLTERQTQTLDVIIEGTTPSSIAFGSGDVAANHPLVFLETSSAQGRQVYIYPFAAGIFTGPASLTYYPLPNGVITTQELVRTYTGRHNAIPDFPIKANGVIAPNGIKYATPAAPTEGKDAPADIRKGGAGDGTQPADGGQPAPGQPGPNF